MTTDSIAETARALALLRYQFQRIGIGEPELRLSSFGDGHRFLAAMKASGVARFSADPAAAQNEAMLMGFKIVWPPPGQRW